MAFNWKDILKPTKAKLAIFTVLFIFFVPCAQIGIWRWDRVNWEPTILYIHDATLKDVIFQDPVQAFVGWNMVNLVGGAIISYGLACALVHLVVPKRAVATKIK